MVLSLGGRQVLLLPLEQTDQKNNPPNRYVKGRNENVGKDTCLHKSSGRRSDKLKKKATKGGPRFVHWGK